MMRLQNWLWVAVAMGVWTAAASAEPMRTIYVKENKFPGAMKGEVALGGMYQGIDNDAPLEDGNLYSIVSTVRFGLSDRVALSLDVPFNGYKFGEAKESGLGDIRLGGEFLLFEDIFEYCWILPYANVSFPSGDEDKSLGNGEAQGQFGVSIGTTVNDVLHFGADVNYTINGSQLANDDDVLAGGLSLIWDLDECASLFGEVQFRDDPIDEDDSYWARGHGGAAYKINEMFTVMGLVGSATEAQKDYYAGGRVVFSF